MPMAIRLIGNWPQQIRGGCYSWIPVLALRTLSPRRTFVNVSPHALTVLHVFCTPADITR